jgi:NAD(P)-dependent dehydrogenase (short-subunit alcohol dehydrogenase family)
MVMSNKVAIVTGATGGLGSAIVARLLAADYRVIACARDEAKLKTCASHKNIYPFAFDVCTWQPVEIWTQILTTVPLCDVSLLVCAHGAAPLIVPTTEVCLDAFRKVYETDVVGTLKMAQACYPLMRERGGSMVFVSSLHAKMTYPARASYTSAKSAVCGLARTIALEWGPLGIRVNTILPWQCTGPRGDAFVALARTQGYDLLEAYKQRSPLRRLITPAEVADTVLWLANTPSMNGAEIVLDGGVSASMWYEGYQG